MNNPASGVSKAAFSVEVFSEHDELRVVLAGNGDMDAAPILGKYVSVLHNEAMQHKAKVVAFDITRLYFLNSSCLKSLASLVALNSKLAASDQYKMIFRLGLPWQRRTIAALQSLGKGFVIIEDCARGAESSSA